MSIVDSWQASPMADVTFVHNSQSCATGYVKLTDTSWPGANTPGCACPPDAISTINNARQASDPTQFCDGNQTSGACAVQRGRTRSPPNALCSAHSPPQPAVNPDLPCRLSHW